jgi:hypothetical protein
MCHGGHNRTAQPVWFVGERFYCSLLKRGYCSQQKESGVPVTGSQASPKKSIGSPAFLQTLGILLIFVSCTGCAFIPDVRRKPQVINPFPQIQTVAVLPFFNQSGEPTLSGQRVAMAYSNEIQSIRGFEVLPIGATESKISEFGRPLNTGSDFQDFAQFLGVDAVLVGSVTDYQPYYPPRMTIKVNWYAANPGFHPVMPGYGLPWGTRAEKEIPRWVHQEAQRALAVEQMKTQTPVSSSGPEALGQQGPDSDNASSEGGLGIGNASPEEIPLGQEDSFLAFEDILPEDWPDPRGFVPDPPSPVRPPLMVQSEPIISHMASFNGHDEDFTESLANYFYFRDDARFGGWQGYLQRSEDFIRFCCFLHLNETLIARGGQDKSRLILRWPIVRYTR